MLKHLRQLWDDELYCDVVLKVGDKLISSHRVVLCAGSRYVTHTMCEHISGYMCLPHQSSEMLLKSRERLLTNLSIS